MPAFFTTHFKEQAFLGTVTFPMTLRAVLFRYAPSLYGDTTAYEEADTKANLEALPGWDEVAGISVYPFTNTISANFLDIGQTRYIMFTEIPFTQLTEPVEVAAIGIELVGSLGGVTNPLIFVSTTPTDGFAKVSGADSLSARLDPKVVAGNQRWMFGWQRPPASPPAGLTMVNPVEGPLALVEGAPDFEVSNTQHVWCYPQRANMVANPSFEKDGAFWASNAAVTRVANPSLIVAGAVDTSTLLTGITTPAVGAVYLVRDTGRLWQYLGPDPNNNPAKWADIGPAPGGAWAGQIRAGEPAYLNPAVGTITTPDPGVPPAAMTLVYKVRGPTGPSTPEGVIVSQAEGPPQSWSLARSFYGGQFWGYSTNGSNWFQRGSSSSATGFVPVAGQDEVLALSRNRTAGGTTYQEHKLVNGTWQVDANFNHNPADTGIPFDVNTVMRIGRYGPSYPFAGRIYWVELRTGVDPAAGTVVWRFDASEYPGSGTNYTDPRGRAWTLTSAAALVPPSAPGYVAPIRVESNVFPTRLGDMPTEDWTIQLLARGNGEVKVGLVYWDSDVRFTAVDWGQNEDEEQWVLSSEGWRHIAVHRKAYQGHIAMVRIECDGTELLIDNVLAERGFLRDWLYFDGDSTYGARDDYSWYGSAVDSDRRGASYSLWYNNRRAVVGRLFARTVDLTDPDDNITDSQIEAMGLAYRWVPAGTTVVPHLDVFYPEDVQAPVPPKGATILPYADPADPAPTGVLSPWV